MNAPDLFKIKPPFAHVLYSSESNSSEIIRNINQHFYNHCVTVFFPDTLHVPVKIKNVLIADSDYYLIKNCQIYTLVETSFIEAFVNQGEVTLLSVDTLIDVDNCFSVTPSGNLVLSIHRSLFLKLGIEKGPAVKIECLKKENRYLIVINLKHPCFKAEKNNYKRVLKQLYLNGLSADIIVTWNPQDINVCPSSLASYFHKKGYRCEECTLSYKENRLYNVEVPMFQADSDQLFEWLGLFLLGVTEIKQDDTYEYLSSYQIPEESETVGQVLVIESKGIISSNRIAALFNILRCYISERSSIPWIGVHIQGFEDAPVAWNLEPHRSQTEGAVADAGRVSPFLRRLLSPEIARLLLVVGIVLHRQELPLHLVSVRQG